MPSEKTFKDLGVIEPFLETLGNLGYEHATPVQEESIPLLLQGRDLLGQAQTGTGKTAAFSVPLLMNIDININKPQAMVIAPTRELAIQVAEALQSYSKGLKDFHVTPIYGGQPYTIQLRSLKRGSHVIVGTPGRVMDHMRRGSLAVDSIKMLVLDEADEMLKMGFIDDIEWILEQIKQSHQTALFSATMSAPIKKIASRYLKNPSSVHIKPQERTVGNIEQCYIAVDKSHKLEALTRCLEVEDIQAAIIFSRTKTGAAELADKLKARGHAAAALHGDMNQAMRERVISQLKKSHLDIVVATDVAARGLDVERISHVINFDIPCDSESYIHRIGRTGRAGRSGKAILFVTPRESRLLKDIERTIQAKINQVAPPSASQLTEKRSKDLAQAIAGILDKSKNVDLYRAMVDRIVSDSDCDIADVAVGLAYLLQQANPLPTHDMATAAPVAEQSRRRNRGRSERRDRDSFGEGKRRSPKKHSKVASSSGSKEGSATRSASGKDGDKNKAAGKKRRPKDSEKNGSYSKSKRHVDKK